ncbi:MAG: zeta toxin family protein [Verrucomicrobiae bacterium]|nr:zeta toxin family protein [Verrucomicrobiae bacterium]
MATRAAKKIIIIAGPNGAGKTTFAKGYLKSEVAIPTFINADEIAAAISKCGAKKVAIEAGRAMLAQIAQRVSQGKSFAFETTLSGLIYALAIPRWQAAGYHVKLIFLSLPNPEMAIARVAARVAQGGHHIEEAVIRRRFTKGWKNFQKRYKLIVDAWVHYDNSSTPPVLKSQGVRHEAS